MLYPFNPELVTFQNIKLKSISTMMGGQLSYLDPSRSTSTKEVFGRMKVPSNVALLYKKINKITQYLVPQDVCLMKYDGQIVAVEKHGSYIDDHKKNTNLAGEEIEWKSYMEINFGKIMKDLYNSVKQWYFDGSFIYTFDCDVTELGNAGVAVTSDGKFRSVSCAAYRVAMMYASQCPNQSSRQCLVYKTNSGIVTVTPPIWSALGNVRKSKMDTNNNDLETDGLMSQFDRIEELMAVNLNFALAAGTTLSKQFGYKSIEPLQLPKLMIQLKTVNLPNLSAGVKSTFDIGMTFTQAMGWLMGCLYRVETFEEMLAIRKLLKYLPSRGVFNRDSVRKMKRTEEEVPLLTPEQALENAKLQGIVSLDEQRLKQSLEEAFLGI